MKKDLTKAHTMAPPTWHSRGYLPHWEAGEVAQSMTFRLADSLPKTALERLRDDLKRIPEGDQTMKRRIRIEEALDRGRGSAILSNPDIGEIVETALLHFDAQRYRLHAWCVMPNHVHALITPLADWTLSAITHSWKSFTSKKANALLGKQGAFWAPEYYDRAIRDDAHCTNAVDYIAKNPVKANLCARPQDWRFSSAWRCHRP
ncbi:MAG: transposase [Alphaproteobacteria bacterium]|nr:transposase [Alphaproteobacteria bacterium]